MNEEYALELIERGRRVDGRRFDELRKIEIVPNIVKNAEGSASVKFGETEVIAGVKMGIGEPFADTPNEGILVVNAEFSPLASPDFEAGPPGEDAIELARIVDRGIRSSNCVKMEDLCIEPGKKVWCVFVDIHIINHRGNLLDASALASLVALLNTKIPKLEGEKIVREEFERELPVQFKPINVNVCKIKDKFLVDPILEEEEITEARLSVSVRDDDRICALQKQGNAELEIDEIEKMIEIAIEKSRKIRKLVS
ncbi:MAG: exosome complex protein Rrp42 [Candidatus Aenigmatarchaeota archaeon]